MTENEMLLMIYNDMKDIKTHVANIEVQMNDTNTRVINLEAQMKDTNARVINLEAQMKDTNARVINLEAQMTRLENRVINLEDRVTRLEKQTQGISLTLENETNRNIKLVAEGHLDLSRKLDDALKVENEKEMLLIRVNILENEVRKLKEQIELIA